MPTTTRRTGTKPKTAATTTRRAKASAVVAKKPVRASITVEDLADFNESINIMIHGDSGVGKTPLAGMAPRAVFLSTEKGTISAKRFGSTAKLIRATSWEKLEAALEYLKEHPDDFDWVILDSVTKMQVLLMRYLLQVNVAEARKSADLDLPQLQDHQKWQNMFKRYIDDFIDLEINCIFIATSMHREDAEGDDLVLPHITGKDYEVAQYVMAQMDSIFCLKSKPNKKTGDPVWHLLTKRQEPFFAKDRFDAFDTVVVAPTMPQIIKGIENSMPSAGANPNVVKRRAKGKSEVEPEDLDQYEDDLDPDQEEDYEEETKPKARKPATRKPASRTARKAAPVVEEDDEDENFDPEEDDDEELEFDDEDDDYDDDDED